MDVIEIIQSNEPVMVTNEIYLVMAFSVILITFKFVYYYRLKIDTSKKCKFFYNLSKFTFHSFSQFCLHHS